MSINTISLQRLTYFTVLLFLTVYLLMVGQSILVPLAFGALFAFMLKPICGFIEGVIKWRIGAIVLSLVTVILPISLVVYFFSTQLVDVIQDIPSIKDKLNIGVEKLYAWFRQAFGFTKAEADQVINEQVPKLIKGPLSFLGDGFSSSTTAIAGFFLTIIYTFLFLLYRSAFKNFILAQIGKNDRSAVSELIGKIQKLIQKYLYGLSLVIIILGVLNSLGLWIIGIKYPLFWGFLAAALAIVPYIGTFIGGLLPFLYALATTGEMWQPFAVIVLFGVIQGLEGNLITPNVVGSTININPLAAIIALLVGAKIWGVAGMVLALPLIAVIKEILKQSDAWRPVGYLLSDEIAENRKIFTKNWDKEKFRLRSFFKK